jgi:hypothetical protein
MVIAPIAINGAYPALKEIPAIKKAQPPEFGFMGPMASVKGVLHCGLGLTIVLILILETL